MQWRPYILSMILVSTLSGCGSYRMADFDFVSIKGINAKELSTDRLKADATPITYSYSMPETEENDGRMISFTDMVGPGELQRAIDSAAAAQGADCIGLKDASITYEWIELPPLGGDYWYKVSGTPVRRK